MLSMYPSTGNIRTEKQLEVFVVNGRLMDFIRSDPYMQRLCDMVAEMVSLIHFLTVTSIAFQFS